MVVKKLTDYLEREVAKTKVSFSDNKDKFRDYLIGYELRDYFGDEVPEEEKDRLRSSLEQKLDSKLDHYHTELEGIVRRTASKGTMGLAILNDLSAYVSNIPILNVTGFGYALFALKTAAEAPALRRYWQKTHDWYGAADLGGYMLMKPARYLLPGIGAYLEAGAFERMVRKRVLKEVKAEFIKEHGKYQEFEERLKDKLKQPVHTTIDREKKKAA